MESHRPRLPDSRFPARAVASECRKETSRRTGDRRAHQIGLGEWCRTLRNSERVQVTRAKLLLPVGDIYRWAKLASLSISGH